MKCPKCDTELEHFSGNYKAYGKNLWNDWRIWLRKDENIPEYYYCPKCGEVIARLE